MFLTEPKLDPRKIKFSGSTLSSSSHTQSHSRICWKMSFFACLCLPVSNCLSCRRWWRWIIDVTKRLLGRVKWTLCADQNVRLKLDDPNDPRHGYLEYQVQGLWGAVCAATLDINTATVACKQLGFTGGVPYRPNINRYRQVLCS